jgi:hypothetical protein
MSIQNGQPVNQQVTNAGFLSRTTDSDTVAKIGLKNTDVDSGANILNAQKAINKAFDVAGISSESDATAKDYANNNYIADGDNRKVAIEKLDQAVKDVADDLSTHESALDPHSQYATDSDLSSGLALKYDASNPSNYQTEAEVDAKIAALVDSSPAALDTLNELAAALGDDPNFATTVTNSLAGKEPTITATTAADYYRGDKTFQPLNKTAVGLSNVTNDAQLKRSSNDFNTFTEKVTIDDDDLLLIEDSVDSGNKKKIKKSLISSSFSGSIENSFSLIHNLGLSVSVASNALTIAVKQKDGTDPSTGSAAVKAAFRNSTLTNGTYNIREITAPLSFTVSSGSTLGHASGINHGVYVYLIDNAGALELAVSQILFPESGLVTTTAEGGAGGADSNNVVYSATARTSVPFRVIGKIISNQSTAGLWASAPLRVMLGDYGSLYPTENIVATYRNSSGQNIPNNSTTNITNWSKTEDTHNILDPTSGIATIPIDGFYEFSLEATLADATSLGNRIASILNITSGIAFDSIAPYEDRSSKLRSSVLPPFRIFCAAGNQIAFRYFQDSGGSLPLTANAVRNFLSIRKVGSNV